MAWFTKSVLGFYSFLSGALIFFVVLNWDAYGASTAGITLYFLIPLAGFAFSAFLLFFSTSDVREIFVFATLAALTTGYLFESYLFVSQKAISASADRPSAAEFLKQEVPIFLPPGPMEFAAGIEISPGELVNPLGGVPDVPTAVWVAGSEQPEIFISDRFGFRNPDSVWDNPKIRFAAVGDSFTFGAESTEANSIVGRLRALEPSTVNVARGGNGPVSELATIREYLAGHSPDVVIWFYYKNDMEQDIYRDLRDPILARYMDPGFSQNLASRKAEYAEAYRAAYIAKVRDEREPEETVQTAAPDDRWIDWLQFGQGANPLNNLSFLTLRRTRTSLRLIKGGGDWPDPLEETMGTILGQAKNSVAEWGGELLFVYLPGWEEIVDNDRTKFDFRNAALGAAHSAQIPVLDLFDVFDAHPDPKSLWPNRKPGHYGQQGNALASDMVVQWLVDLGKW